MISPHLRNKILCWSFLPTLTNICQALSISQSLNLSLSLRDRDSWHYNHSATPHHTIHWKLFKHLEVTYGQVWYIIGIISSSPADFHSEKIGLIRVIYDPLSVLGLINIIVTYTQVWYIIGIISSSPTDFHSEKIGLIRVTYDPLSVLGLINI